MSEEQYFGSQIAEAAEKVTHVQLREIHHNKPTYWKDIPVYIFIITFVFTVMFIFWASVSQEQQHKTYLK